jgi:putative hemolysin
MIAFVLLRVFLILLLIAANAFFAAAEFALVSVRDTRIQQLIEARRIGARIVQRLHRNLDEVVNGVQLGITIVSLTLGWVGEPLLAHAVEELLGQVPHANVYAHGIAIVLAFALITCLHVILGELVPKSLALQRGFPHSDPAIHLRDEHRRRVGAPPFWLAEDSPGPGALPG